MEGANTKMDCIDKVAEAVKHMEEDLRRKFLENGQEIKLWENTYVLLAIISAGWFTLCLAVKVLGNDWKTVLILTQDELLP